MTKDVQTTLMGFVNHDLLSRDTGAAIDANEELLLSGLLDSIAVMRLVGFIESNLGITVPADQVTLENFSTIAILTARLATLKAEATAQ